MIAYEVWWRWQIVRWWLLYLYVVVVPMDMYHVEQDNNCRGCYKQYSKYWWVNIICYLLSSAYVTVEMESSGKNCIENWTAASGFGPAYATNDRLSQQYCTILFNALSAVFSSNLVVIVAMSDEIWWKAAGAQHLSAEGAMVIMLCRRGGRCFRASFHTDGGTILLREIFYRSIKGNILPK